MQCALGFRYEQGSPDSARDIDFAHHAVIRASSMPRAGLTLSTFDRVHPTGIVELSR
jgi:hypothetical protein